MNDEIRILLYVVGSLLIVCFTVGLLLVALTYRRLRRIKLPPHADFWTTVRAVPLLLVIGLDLLDLGLDMFAAPLVWVILSRFRLQALRNVATVEALIPFTQPIPTLTVAWFAARLLNLGQQPRRDFQRTIDTDEVGPGRYVPRAGKR
jgi:hypothetical protein